MDEEIEIRLALLTLAVGALIALTPARRRGQLLARIDAEVGNPAIVPISDGDRTRFLLKLRELYERLLPSWLA